MPQLQVIGVVPSKGNYEGYDYDNLNLHCVNEAKQGKGFGTLTEIVKVKRNLFPEATQKNPAALVNTLLKVAYDKSGKVEEVELV